MVDDGEVDEPKDDFEDADANEDDCLKLEVFNRLRVNLRLLDFLLRILLQQGYLIVQGILLRDRDAQVLFRLIYINCLVIDINLALIHGYSAVRLEC